MDNVKEYFTRWKGVRILVRDEIVDLNSCQNIDKTEYFLESKLSNINITFLLNIYYSNKM